MAHVMRKVISHLNTREHSKHHVSVRLMISQLSTNVVENQQRYPPPCTKLLTKQWVRQYASKGQGLRPLIGLFCPIQPRNRNRLRQWRQHMCTYEKSKTCTETSDQIVFLAFLRGPSAARATSSRYFLMDSLHLVKPSSGSHVL